MLLFKRDLKESNDVPTPRLIDYMFIYFEFERVKMFCYWFIGKNSDRKRVPKVNTTVRERALQVVRTVPLELVAKLAGMLTRCSRLFPCSHYVGRSEGQREHAAQSSSWCCVPKFEQIRGCRNSLTGMQCLQGSCLTNDTESSGLDGVELSQVCWRHTKPNKRAVLHKRPDKSLVNCSATPAVQHRCRLAEEVEPLVGANGGAMKMPAKAQLTVKGDAKGLQAVLGWNSLILKQKGR